MGSWTRFGLLFLGVSVMFLGVGAWFPLHDTDYGYGLEYSTEDPPRHEGDITVYGVLSPEERRVVDRAIAGEPQRIEHGNDLPASVVRKNGTYYVFNAYAYFDWASPRTFGPTLAGFVGVGMIVEAIRRDVKS